MSYEYTCTAWLFVALLSSGASGILEPAAPTRGATLSLCFCAQAQYCSLFRDGLRGAISTVLAKRMARTLLLFNGATLPFFLPTVPHEVLSLFQGVDLEYRFVWRRLQ